MPLRDLPRPAVPAGTRPAPQPAAPAPAAPPHPLLQHARGVLRAHLDGYDWREHSARTVPGGPLPARGCFVSLKLAGRLRGCIGTVLPVCPTLEEEVAANALGAATRDPRFGPLRPAELAGVRLSIDLLTPPEPVAGPAVLDPQRYGVVLRGGGRAGVLLPDIPGVHTAAQQVAICQEKAGLAAHVPYTLERFQVERLTE